jgi:hypothetical protein
MIVKISKHGNSRQVLNYIAKKDSARLLMAEHCGVLGDKLPPLEIIETFAQMPQLNPRVKNRVSHIILSLPQERQMSMESWQGYVQKFLHGLGYDNAPWAAYQHVDTEKQHCHILASRIRLNGKCVSDKFDYYRAQNIIRDLNQVYELPSFSRDQVSSHYSLSLGECRHLDKGSPPSYRQQAQTYVAQGLKQTKNLDGLIGYLGSNEVTVHLITDKQRTGIVFEYKGFYFSGTNLGKSYSYPKVIAQLERNQLIERPNSFKVQKQALLCME